MGQSQVIENALKGFGQKDNQMTVGGKTINDWALEHGTPLYLYDFSIVRRQITLFREHFPKDIQLFYAVKANPNKDLLKGMADLVDGFDVASAGELKKVTGAGGDPSTISFAGPGKSALEIKQAVEAGIGSINVESERELEMISREATQQGRKPKVSIRINPDFELHGSGMKMGGGPKQFGIDAEQVPSVLNKLDRFQVDFQGFHIYTGSQNLAADSIAEVMEQSLALCLRLAGNLAGNIRLLNLGGGFGIPYFNKDLPLDIARIGERLRHLNREYKPKFPNAKFVIELGRYLVGEAGLYLTRVLYEKMSRGKKFLIIDGGMNHHLAASGNFGQVLRKNFPVVVGTNLQELHREKVDIVGPLCTPLDLMGSKIEIAKAHEGDLIVFMNSGAYGYSASPLLFLGHDAPGEVLAHD